MRTCGERKRFGHTWPVDFTLVHPLGFRMGICGPWTVDKEEDDDDDERLPGAQSLLQGSLRLQPEVTLQCAEGT